jgi:hypothetical protein
MNPAYYNAIALSVLMNSMIRMIFMIPAFVSWLRRNHFICSRKWRQLNHASQVHFAGIQGPPLRRFSRRALHHSVQYEQNNA